MSNSSIDIDLHSPNIKQSLSQHYFETIEAFFLQISQRSLDKLSQQKIASAITDQWINSPPWEKEQRKTIHRLLITPYVHYSTAHMLWDCYKEQTQTERYHSLWSLFCQESKNLFQENIINKTPNINISTPIECELLFNEGLLVGNNINGNNALYHLIEAWDFVSVDLQKSCINIFHHLSKKEKSALWLNERKSSAWARGCEKEIGLLWEIPHEINELELKNGFVSSLRSGAYDKMTQIIQHGGMSITEAAKPHDWLMGFIAAQNSQDSIKKEKILKLCPTINAYQDQLDPIAISNLIIKKATVETMHIWLETQSVKAIKQLMHASEEHNHQQTEHVNARTFHNLCQEKLLRQNAKINTLKYTQKRI